ncbi:MAG: hypothetical protein ACOYJN_05620 [Acutalibacteraceae bacterium]|mgnify:CR=1 FL=1|nr:hypothetical protein [Clostridiales bacterium]
MSKYGTYKYQIALIYKYLYNEFERLDYEMNERNIYFSSGRRKRDEIDYLDDMALQIKADYLKQIKDNIYSLIGMIEDKDQ